jgi:hypothetical protein
VGFPERDASRMEAWNIPDNGKPAATPGRKATGPRIAGGSGATEGRHEMFASSQRNRRPNFSSRKKQPSKPSKVISFLTATTVIALATWGGVTLAKLLGGSDGIDNGIDNGIVRFINRLAYDISNIDPVLSAIAAGLFGMVLLVFFIRDHN